MTTILLADLLTDPGRVQELPSGAIPALLAQCAALQAALAARMLDTQEESPRREEPPTGDGDRWLTAEQAHTISGLGVQWLYRHWRTVPGAKKFSRRRLRFHGPAFRRWLKKGA